jgi:hypothetical protein
MLRLDDYLRTNAAGVWIFNFLYCNFVWTHHRPAGPWPVKFRNEKPEANLQAWLLDLDASQLAVAARGA